VTYVLSGGVIAAFLGPICAQNTANLTSQPYLGSYLIVAIVGLANQVTIALVSFPPPPVDSILDYFCCCFWSNYKKKSTYDDDEKPSSQFRFCNKNIAIQIPKEDIFDNNNDNDDDDEKLLIKKQNSKQVAVHDNNNNNNNDDDTKNLKTETQQQQQVRDTYAIVSDFSFIISCTIATLAHTIMVMLMSNVTLQMNNNNQHHYSFNQSSLVMELHFFAMFSPGFITGYSFFKNLNIFFCKNIALEFFIHCTNQYII
jgi:hypothetical protein